MEVKEDDCGKCGYLCMLTLARIGAGVYVAITMSLFAAPSCVVALIMGFVLCNLLLG